MEFDVAVWLIFVLMVALIGLMSATEIALTASSRSEIRRLAEQGNRRAAMIDELLAEPEQFWLTSMLVKTAGLLGAGLAVGWEFLPTSGLLTLLITGIVAWLILAVVQIISRAAVIGDADAVALRLIPFATFWMTVLSPLTLLLYRTGVHVSGETQQEADESIFLSEDGLRLLLQVSEEESTIQESEKQMIAGILEMDETVAREVMVPRIDMFTLPVGTALQPALDAIIEAGHSRIPVYEESVDQIAGLVYAKDLLKALHEQRTGVALRDLLRPVNFVPASKKVNALLKEMQQQRMHLAMVVDEYGGIAGLVTIEDIMEEIFGEIRDEYDVDEQLQVQALGEHAYLLNSRLDVGSLGKLLGLDLADDDADTLGGLIYSRLGHVPEPGEALEIDDWRFTVLSLDGRRINEVRADQRSALPAAEPESTNSSASNHKSMLNPSGLS